MNRFKVTYVEEHSEIGKSRTPFVLQVDEGGLVAGDILACDDGRYPLIEIMQRYADVDEDNLFKCQLLTSEDRDYIPYEELKPGSVLTKASVSINS